MTDIIRKIFRAETKVVDEGEGVIEVFVSTGVKDRDGEVILPSAFKKRLGNFKAHPVLLSSHDYRDLRKQIGEFSHLDISESGFKARPKYYIGEGNQEADWGFKLAVWGKAAYSVGFIPHAWEDGDGEKSPRRTFTDVELLEISQVVVPSNPEALVLARAKGLDPIIDEIARELLDREVKQGKYRCECIECGYQMDSDEHCGDIKCPKCGGQMRRAERPGPGQEGASTEDVKGKGAIPYKRTPLAPEDEEWNSGAEVREADVSDLKIMCAWVGEDPDSKASYKLPHHKASGEHACVWAAVRAAAAVLMGARGGVDIPDADINGVKAHIAKHYKDFGKGDPPWERQAMVSQAEVGDEISYTKSLITRGLNEENTALAWELVREVMRLPGGDIPEDIKDQVRVIRGREAEGSLKKALELIQSVLDSTEPAPEEEQIDVTRLAQEIASHLLGGK